MTDQKQRLSDAEIIATFMELRPADRNGAPSCRILSPRGWWIVGPGGPGYRPHTIRLSTLDALHEVEARLTDEQWRDYEGRAFGWWNGRVKSGFRAIAHASPEQKTKTLAEVLRPVVEKESTLRTPEDK